MRSIVIRPADDADWKTVVLLCQLDSAQPLTDGTVLLAEVDGEPVAAVELGTGRTVADPFRRTSEAVELLRTRAGQLERATSSSGPPAGRRNRISMLRLARWRPAEAR